ncbi:MAG TPA: hypothetical protein VEH62_00855 [Gemmatimonadales bacterium]|nr:hypothetical protein [Gemmatimonadales bacterium]
MIARAASALLALSALLAGAWAPRTVRPRPAAGARAAADTFPHARHARLFTTCAACHAGIATGDTAEVWPSPELCAGCHNGDLARTVSWTPPPPRATNLTFEHVPHVAMFEAMDSGGPNCQKCHAAADSQPFMDVGRANPERCVSCHGQGAPSHLAQQACEPCHTTLHDAAALDAEAIRGFPKPPSHDSTWVLGHRGAATGTTCAVCHAQQFCASCHVNARAVQAIRDLPADDRVAALVRGRTAGYPRPASHAASDWTRRHGVLARAGAGECANCHAQESCLGCHRIQERVPAIATLPRRAPGGAFGVDLAGLRPADHLPDQRLHHREMAAGGTASCATCHRPSYCTTCHAAAKAPGFHGPNFVQRHAMQAYAAEAECAACHQVQVFCHDCHQVLGRSNATAPASANYHDRQPGWLFGHGGVARRAIETCASCHAQDFCLRCHSATTGQHINPHGAGFNPSVAGKNRAMCLICHTTGIPTQ